MSKIDDKQIVYINSHDRLSGTDGDYTFNISLKPGNQFDRITLLQAGIPKSYYNIQHGYNYFTLTELGVSVIVTMPPANYTRVTLALVLSSTITAASPHSWTYVVSYPNVATQGDTGFYTYTVSGNTGQPTFSYDDVTFLDELMGFNKNSTNVFSGSVLTSTQVTNLQPFSSVQVHCDMVANDFQTGINTDILQSVYANVGSAPFSNISWTCPEFESFSHVLSSGNTGIIRIYFTDEDSIPIDFHGVNNQLVIMFWKKNTALRLLNGFTKYLVATIQSWQQAGTQQDLTSS